jgi:hypothetical protein
MRGPLGSRDDHSQEGCLNHEVRLDVTPGKATFRWRDEHLSWVPRIYVAPRSRRLERWLKGPVALLSVGTPPTRNTGHEVRLFDSISEPPKGVRKADCLDFFRQALNTLFAGSTFRIKPAVSVHGSRTVAAAFGGYHEDILRKALLTAGAHAVEFQS